MPKTSLSSQFTLRSDATLLKFSSGFYGKLNFQKRLIFLSGCQLETRSLPKKILEKEDGWARLTTAVSVASVSRCNTSFSSVRS